MNKENLIKALLDEYEKEDLNGRYVYHFEDDIEPEIVQEVIDKLSGYNKIDLFFTTLGGEIHSMNVLIHFINNHSDINIYLTGYIASAGTLLFTDCNKPITLTESLDWILFHMGDRAIEGSFRKTTLDYSILNEQLKEANNELADKFSKLGLNKKEIRSFLDGNDVVLYRKDFNRLTTNG
jgi:ATP-dependent protease ClpP protease subunit